MPFASQHVVHKYWPITILLPQTNINFIVVHSKHVVQGTCGDALKVFR